MYELNERTYLFKELFTSKNAPFKLTIEQIHYDVANEDIEAARSNLLLTNQGLRTPFQFALEELFTRCYPMWRYFVIEHTERNRYLVYRVGPTRWSDTFLLQIDSKKHTYLRNQWNKSLESESKYDYPKIPHEIEITPLWEVSFTHGDRVYRKEQNGSISN